MAHGIPIVASDVPPMKRIIEEEECGLIFSSGNPKSFITAVTKLKDESRRRNLGENGKRAALEKYLWKHSERKLSNLFKIGSFR